MLACFLYEIISDLSLNCFFETFLPTIYTYLSSLNQSVRSKPIISRFCFIHSRITLDTDCRDGKLLWQSALKCKGKQCMAYGTYKHRFMFRRSPIHIFHVLCWNNCPTTVHCNLVKNRTFSTERNDWTLQIRGNMGNHANQWNTQELF